MSAPAHRSQDRRTLTSLVVRVGIALTFMGVASTQAHENVSALMSRIEALEQRLLELESERGRPSEPYQIVEQPVPPGGEVGAAAQTTMQPTEDLGQAIPGAERPTTIAAAERTAPPISIGGALRFNVVHRDFADSSSGKRGESGLDVFRLNIDGELDDILISAEYRYYSFMQTIHHGWVGYRFDDDSQVQFGISQVPFGLLPYDAHNVWFGVPYYVGLGDDYDMGVKYIRSDGPWGTQLAFYKNEELNDASDTGRYSFDLVRVDEQQNEEVNQFNGRVDYTFGHGTACEVELGGSAQLAEVYNTLTDRRGDHWAAAAHLDSHCGRWNLQLQATRYRYDPVNPNGVTDEAVRVGAFATSYDIASEADIAIANLAYNFDSPWEEIDQITCYNDYSRLFKDSSGSLDSQINTLGCAIGSGPLFTYIDWILANNMAFFGNGSMAGGGEDKWHSRFNINIGYYW
ncbi:hypothetical protein CWI75_10770 [Kineobactrum sediminis]|uniref:Porin n=1 Tax=Kineobactrum sediminis TaxID=1905677 RepID=A0A2N5Y1J0_9GAMM|nr:hypothetical protein [Kineobactrum sediminis]PLW82253.1 hypothetical protein CWI75_10770 [Kineobactrum sediminis]